MKITSRNKGFSLTEVLMAVGALAVGMLFIGGTLAVAVHLSFASNDQVLGSLVTRDALAKVRLYGVDYDQLPTIDEIQYSVYTNDLMLRQMTEALFDELFTYPVYHGTTDIVEKRYYGRVLCKRSPLPGRLIDVALFVVRDPNAILDRVDIINTVPTADGTQLEYTWIPDIGEPASPFIHGSYMVGEADNRIYRVYRGPSDQPNTITLKGAWTGGTGAWVVLPGRPGPNPLIEVRTARIPR